MIKVGPLWVHGAAALGLSVVLAVFIAPQFKSYPCLTTVAQKVRNAPSVDDQTQAFNQRKGRCQLRTPDTALLPTHDFLKNELLRPTTKAERERFEHTAGPLAQAHGGLSSRSAYLLHLLVDFVFIFLYASWLLRLVPLAADRWPIFARVGTPTVLALATADAVENLSALLLFTSDGDPHRVLTTALLVGNGMKWLGVALICLVALALLVTQRFRSLLAARVPLGCLLILLGVGFVGDPNGTVANALKVNTWEGFFLTGFTVTLAAYYVFFCLLHAWSLGPKRMGGRSAPEIKYFIDVAALESFRHEGQTRRKPFVGVALKEVLRNSHLLRRLPAAALALPLLYQVCALSAREPELNWSKNWPLLSAAIAAGAGLVVLIALAIEIARAGAILTRPDQASPPPPLRWIQGIFRCLKRGFWQPSGRVEFGHWMALGYWILLGLVFFWLFVMGERQLDRGQALSIPVIVSVTLMLSLTCGLLTFLTFVFDRHRLPTVAVLAVYFIALGPLSPDHRVPAQDWPLERSPAVRFKDRLTVDEYLKVRVDKGLVGGDMNTPKVVVISTTGGGIQAAAWTTKVLTELTRLEGFSQSLVFMSGTSGGAVGLYHYLLADPLSAPTPASAAQSAAKAYAAATESTLEAAAWGLAFPDYSRVWLGPVHNAGRLKELDRGWAFEKATMIAARTHIQATSLPCAQGEPSPLESLSLSCFARRAKEGLSPAFVFNSAVVESGEPIWFSNISLDPYTVLNRGLGPDWTKVTHNVRWLESAEGDSAAVLDLGFATAARLSAAFPYVGPAPFPCVAEKGGCREAGRARHAIDGGYVDGPGTLAAFHFIEQTMSSTAFGLLPDESPQMLLIQINAYPVGAPPSASRDPAPGWLTATVGPVLALFSARPVIQGQRKDFEASLMSLRHRENITLVSFDVAPSDRLPPLSWQLANANKQDIARSWTMIEKQADRDRGPLHAVRSFLDLPPAQP